MTRVWNQQWQNEINNLSNATRSAKTSSWLGNFEGQNGLIFKNLSGLLKIENWRNENWFDWILGGVTSHFRLTPLPPCHTLSSFFPTPSPSREWHTFCMARYRTLAFGGPKISGWTNMWNSKLVSTHILFLRKYLTPHWAPFFSDWSISIGTQDREIFNGVTGYFLTFFELVKLAFYCSKLWESQRFLSSIEEFCPSA